MEEKSDLQKWFEELYNSPEWQEVRRVGEEVRRAARIVEEAERVREEVERLKLQRRVITSTGTTD